MDFQLLDQVSNETGKTWGTSQPQKLEWSTKIDNSLTSNVFWIAKDMGTFATAVKWEVSHDNWRSLKNKDSTRKRGNLTFNKFYNSGPPVLVGGIPTPLKNMSSSVGMMKFPIYGKIKNVPNHQPAMVTWTSSVNSGRCLCKFLMLQQQIEDHFWSMHPMTTGCWLSWFQRSKMSQLYLA